VAVELGYAVQADAGRSGRLRHWLIAGVPEEVMEVHSKRAAEIDAECQRHGDNSYGARRVAARATRHAKEHGVEGELMGRRVDPGVDRGRRLNRRPTHYRASYRI
jgi:hypothetical protein